MNIQEGIRRLKLVGKLIVLIGVTLAVLTWFFAGHELMGWQWLIASLGAVIWACGWVFDGFARAQN